MTSGVAADAPQRGALSFRPAREDELAACADVWRLGIDDYYGRLNQPALPVENGSLVRLYAHLRATDPERFVVATRDERIVAFASAVVRERLWYLSMLFVLPEAQRSGVGRALLREVAPPMDGATVRATATDSAQPISNGLYASLGIVPRVPLLDLIGRPERPDAFGPLPSGITAVPFEDLVDGAADGAGHRALSVAVDDLYRDTLGVAHPTDHRFLRGEGRRGWLYHGPDGAPLGYGYAAEAGRIGPVATRDPAVVAPILGHLTGAVVPRGAFAMWLPGTADRAVVAALQAGFRLEGFPVLLCWDRPFADLERYLPISPGLL